MKVRELSNKLRGIVKSNKSLSATQKSEIKKAIEVLKVLEKTSGDIDDVKGFINVILPYRTTSQAYLKEFKQIITDARDEGEKSGLGQINKDELIAKGKECAYDEISGKLKVDKKAIKDFTDIEVFVDMVDRRTLFSKLHRTSFRINALLMFASIVFGSIIFSVGVKSMFNLVSVELPRSEKYHEVRKELKAVIGHIDTFQHISENDSINDKAQFYKDFNNLTRLTESLKEELSQTNRLHVYSHLSIIFLGAFVLLTTFVVSATYHARKRTL